jgi:hypothetical protein
MKAAALTAGLVFGPLGTTGTAADNNGSPRVAFFGFRLINTSLESTTAAEDRRVHKLDELFQEKLGATGRFNRDPARHTKGSHRWARDRQLQRLRT